MHDRIFAPLYPIVFTIITFAYLGAPRTTRQGRAMSIASAAIVIAAIRLMGFVAIVLCVRYPWVLAIQYACWRWPPGSACMRSIAGSKSSRPPS